MDQVQVRIKSHTVKINEKQYFQREAEHVRLKTQRIGRWRF